MGRAGRTSSSVSKRTRFASLIGSSCGAVASGAADGEAIAEPIWRRETAGGSTRGFVVRSRSLLDVDDFDAQLRDLALSRTSSCKILSLPAQPTPIQLPRVSSIPLKHAPPSQTPPSTPSNAHTSH